MTKIHVSPAKAKSHATFVTIRDRLKNHGITLHNHIGSDLKVYESTLHGISFKAKKKNDSQCTERKINPLGPNDFLRALRMATTAGKPVFREGEQFDRSHWAIDFSMAFTTGKGFREITYLNLEDRAPQVRDPSISPRVRAPKMNAIFSSQFGKTRARLDISSLHCAVWGDNCSIHIDDTGFVLEAMPGMGGDVTVTAHSVHHTLLELLWKGIPGIPETLDIYAPNSANDFTRFGIRASAKLNRNLKLSINASYTIRGKRGFSKTVNLTGRF